MYRRCSVAAIVALFTVLVSASAPQVHAYRICTFKGTVIDHGWRSMTLKTGAQCAEVNVGWRTRFVPNRRPCIGERVSVDFTLDDGFMKAVKIVSLTPQPASMQCWPPAPPSTATCRSVDAEEVAVSGGDAPCPSPRAICSNRAPSHVADPAWSPGKRGPRGAGVSPDSGGAAVSEGGRPGKASRAARGDDAGRTVQRGDEGDTSAGRKPTTRAGKEREPVKVQNGKTSLEGKDDIAIETTPGGQSKQARVLTGEVVASSPKSLSIRVTDEGEGAEMINVKVGLKTKFIPFRRPAVGERVKVEYTTQDNGEKVGTRVEVK